MFGNLIKMLFGSFSTTIVETITSPLTKEQMTIYTHKHQKEHCKAVDAIATMKPNTPLSSVTPLYNKLNSLNNRIEVLHNHSEDHRDLDLVSYNAMLLWDSDELKFHSDEIKQHLNGVDHTLLLGLVEVNLCPDLTRGGAKKIRHLIRIAASTVALLDAIIMHKEIANEGKRTATAHVHLKALRSDALGPARSIPRAVTNNML